VRATLNLVNGWMFTGLGPFYLKDSSTAQNILATGVLADFAGAGAADVINSVANLSKVFQQAPAGRGLADVMNSYANLYAKMKAEPVLADDRCVQAEIHVFEPFVTPEGGTEWREINPSATHFEGLLLGSKNFAPPAAENKDIQGIILTQSQKLADAAIEIERAEALARAQSRASFQAQALAAVAGPSDPATDKAVALQALAPSPAKKKCGLFDWLCGKRTQVTNKEATGPTSVTLP
jgi:hypothetical protein